MTRAGRTAVCWMLVLSTVFSTPMVYAQQPAGAAEPEVDLAYVTPDAVAAAVAFPRRLLTDPAMELLPTEVITAAGKKELGIDPLDIEQVLVIVEPPKAGPPGVAAVFYFSKPYDLDEIMPQLTANTVKAELDGLPYLRANSPMEPSLFMPDSRTLILGHDAVLRTMVANHSAPVEGALSKLLKVTNVSGDIAAVAVMDPVRQMLSAALAMAPVPQPFAGVKRIPELVDAVKFQVKIKDGLSGGLAILCPDESAAEELEELINQMLVIGQQMAMAEMSKQADSDDPVEQAMAQYMKRINQVMFDSSRPSRKGNILAFSSGGAGQTELTSVAVVGILVALLLPAVQAAREAARRTQSMNNLRQIGLAMHNYNAVHNHLPARASSGEDGKPLLSWRVHLLPFIEQQALYEQFHLDEPWDSKHNSQLIPMVPEIYRNPSSPAGPDKSDYMVPVADGTIFGGKEGAQFSDIADGTAGTIMAVEVNPDSAVVWTKPDDFQYNPAEPLAGLGKAHPGGFLALFADGHVKFIDNRIPPQTFRELLMMADNGSKE